MPRPPEYDMPCPRGCARWFAVAAGLVVFTAGCQRSELPPVQAGPRPAVPATRDPDVSTPPRPGGTTGMPEAGIGNDHSSPAHGSSAPLPAPPASGTTG